MRFLSLIVVALMVCATIAEKTKLTEREMEEMKELQTRLETDPEFRREVEAQLDAKVSELPEEERAEAKKRFWGLLGLGLWNPFLFPFFGKRSVEETTVETPVEATTMRMMETTMDKEMEMEMTEEKQEMAKRFWGLWGLGYGYGLGYPWGLGLWGKKRAMPMMEEGEEMAKVDEELMKKREEEFKRFEAAEKRLAPETFKAEGETYSKVEVDEMKKRWWGLGYGYGMGLGYGYGLGYPWGFWGKREATPMTGEKRDAFVLEEMKKVNREAAYERLLRDL